MKINCAPIALFVYDRPWHTRQTVEALLANAEATETPLYVFSDAPKDVEASKAVMEVRSYIRKITGFKSLSIIERESNIGLAHSIIDGVSKVCEECGRVIVLEDDLVTSAYFLQFMNEGLEKYQDEQRVVSIYGYLHPVEQALPDTFFLKASHSWGWATWKRGWELFDPDGQRLLDELRRRELTHQFDFDGSYPFTRMLQNQISGKNNSWAILWYASTFLKDKLTLYPGRSLVHNNGMDGSGVHCSVTSAFTSIIADHPILVETIAVKENFVAKQAIVNYFNRTRPALPVRIARKMMSKLFNKYNKLIRKYDTQQHRPK